MKSVTPWSAPRTCCRDATNAKETYGQVRSQGESTALRFALPHWTGAPSGGIITCRWGVAPQAPRQKGTGVVSPPQQDASGLSDFLKRTKSATMKQVQDLAGASSLGVYLAEGASEGSTADTYKVRTAWDHKDKAKRAKCVRTMGTESADRHEVWLTLWSKDRADMEAIRTAAGDEPSWEPSEGGRYQRGPFGLGFDEAKGTVTLIYAEGRTSPFTSAEYRAHLGELFDDLAALLASAGPAAAPAAAVPKTAAPAAAVPKAPVQIPVAQAARPARPAEEPQPAAHAQAYGSPADLVAALQSGEIEIYKKSVSVKVRGRDADVVVVDESRGKGLTLTIAGVGEVDAGVLAACRGALKNPSFSARRADEGSLVIRRKLRSMPAPADIREALDYAADFLEVLESGPPPPEGRPAEEALSPPDPSVEAAPGEAASPAETAAPLPSPPEPAAAEPSPAQPAAEEAPPPAGPPTEAPSEQAVLPSGSSSEIVEVEEISLEELLGTSAEETPAPTEPAPPGSEPAVAEPPDAAAPESTPQPGEAADGGQSADAPERELAKGIVVEPSGQLAKEPVTKPPEEGPGILYGKDDPGSVYEAAHGVPEEVPATLFGNFVARRAIGRDVLGVLYAGEDTESGRPVSIKVIDLEHTQNVRFAQTLIRESWGAAKLEHEGLKRVLTVGRTPAHIYYYVSEFVEGVSVRTLVESEGAFSAADSGRIVLALCEALAFAHSQKVFHGDIRPSHVLLTPDGGVKLGEMAGARNVLRCVERLIEKLGWNLADALEGEENEARAETERLIRERGVIAWYMAPELADPQSQADARADVYGLGATWYYMLVGRPPFQGNPPIRVLTGEAGAAVPPHEANPAVPAEVSRVVQKMMDRVPSKRYQLMEEVMAELAGLMGL